MSRTRPEQYHTLRLSGVPALGFARATQCLLSKYADPTEPARTHLSLSEAEDVAREDAGLLYVDLRELSPDSDSFAAACVSDNTARELLDALANGPDAGDCETWDLSGEAWAEQIACALVEMDRLAQQESR